MLSLSPVAKPDKSRYCYETVPSNREARYYNPLIRRFINSDPARDAWNWFAYASGNPISLIDPNGTNPLLLIPLIIYGTTQIANAPGPNDPTFANPPNVEEALLLSGAGPAATLGRATVSGAAAGGRSFMNTLTAQTTGTLGSQGARIGGLGTITAEQGFIATGTLARTTATSATNASLSASQNLGANIITNYTRFAVTSGSAGLGLGLATDLQPDDANLSFNPFTMPFEIGNLAGGLISAELPSFGNSFNSSSSSIK